MKKFASTLVVLLATVTLLFAFLHREEISQAFKSIPSIPSLAEDGRKVISFSADADSLRVYCAEKEEGGITFGDAIRRAKEEGLAPIAATNGGMFTLSHAPVGLCVSEGKHISSLKRPKERRGGDNFALPLNGIFLMGQDGRPMILPTATYKGGKDRLNWATQSGPMLLHEGKENPAFRKGSPNLALRSGVGVSRDGAVHFAISKGKVNFWDFAQEFKKLGCENALFLDGTVSRMWFEGDPLPDDRFGVVIVLTTRP